MTAIAALPDIYSKYQTETIPVEIHGRRLQFIKPKEIDCFIDPDDPLKGFPLWAKMWEASAVLAEYMAHLPAVPPLQILELGAGLGVAGITAATFGHRVTITEYDSHALEFLNANALLNHCTDTAIRRLDWARPDLEGHFDLIIGSEIVYSLSSIDLLAVVFQKYLRPQGRIVLAEGVRATGVRFWERMAAGFDIRVRKTSLRCENEKRTILLFEMSPKQTASF
jgi:2-polyprenyl-3-methyl-5-hydroxy-6-metoxy-1,4-benzoquinol methylase